MELKIVTKLSGEGTVWTITLIGEDIPTKLEGIMGYGTSIEDAYWDFVTRLLPLISY